MTGLLLVRGGKSIPASPPSLGLPCDSCECRRKAPIGCVEDCLFISVRQRRIKELVKARSRGRKARRTI